MSDPLPSFDTVEAETQAALAELLAVLPTTSPVERLGEDTFRCGSLGIGREGAGVSFTDHVAVVQADDFDIDDFIVNLPARMGPSFTASELEPATEIARVRIIATEHGGTLLSVSAREADGERFVEIYAYSRCGQPPSDESIQG